MLLLVFLLFCTYVNTCFGRPNDKEIFQVSNSLYYKAVTYEDHYTLIDFNIVFMSGYTERHFWHQVSLLYFSIEINPDLKQSFDNIINVMKKPYIDSKTTDCEIDVEMIDVADTILEDILERPEYLTSPLHHIQALKWKSLTDLYSRRISDWGAKLCVVDIINRNYLIMIHQYLQSTYLFIEKSLFVVFRNIYMSLTDYSRFYDCGDIIVYSNILTRVDTLFNANFLRDGINLI